MGLNFDLATVASLAGLGGSTVAGIAAFMFFKGFLMRILAQVIVTGDDLGFRHPPPPLFDVPTRIRHHVHPPGVMRLT